MNHLTLEDLLKRFHTLKTKFETLHMDDKANHKPSGDWECAENVRELQKFVTEVKRVHQTQMSPNKPPNNGTLSTVYEC